jgi:hypothetical protein
MKLTWRVFHKRQELFTLGEHLGSPLFFVGFLLLIKKQNKNKNKDKKDKNKKKHSLRLLEK